MTERMGISLENLFRQSDEATAECVLYDDVQQSLRSKGVEEVSRIGLSKYFAYVGPVSYTHLDVYKRQSELWDLWKVSWNI